METLYYVGFCFFLIGIIVWGFKDDDYGDFHSEPTAKKNQNAVNESDIGVKRHP